MKKITVILTALLLLLCLSGCKKDSEPKIAVVYFSITGNTEKVAEEIASRLNATKVELLPKVAYTDDDLSYTDMTCRSRVEQSDKLRVEYGFSLDKLEDYDYIFIGYPIW
ncbi:MAG: flavodoxin, partial [Erysipelotrichaceae bacterium]|nr:flavodoxin [Erysipelotrichaceae bacterium]